MAGHSPAFQWHYGPVAPYCCEMMRSNIEKVCEQHDHAEDCPDRLGTFVPKFNEFGLPVHDGGSSYVIIEYCLWCGGNSRNRRVVVGSKNWNDAESTRLRMRSHANFWMRPGSARVRAKGLPPQRHNARSRFLPFRLAGRDEPPVFGVMRAHRPFSSPT